MREMHQQMADMKSAMDEQLHQAKQRVQEAQEGWQDAVTRATTAEEHAMMLETEFSSKVDNQLCRQNWKNAPNQQMIGSLSAAPVEDDLMGEVTPDKGKGRERHSDGDDANMEVKVFHYVLYTLISVIGFI